MGASAGAAGTGMSAAGTILAATGQLAKGSAAVGAAQSKQIEDNFEALQLTQDAGQSIAVSQRNAVDVGRQTTLINSKALANAAASGAGASDPTVISTIARTAGEGAYRQGVALYEGEAQARMDRIRAASATLEGNIGVTAANAADSESKTAALSTVLTGGSNAYSMYRKYNPQAPSSTTIGNTGSNMGAE